MQLQRKKLGFNLPWYNATCCEMRIVTYHMSLDALWRPASMHGRKTNSNRAFDSNLKNEIHANRDWQYSKSNSSGGATGFFLGYRGAYAQLRGLPLSGRTSTKSCENGHQFEYLHVSTPAHKIAQETDAAPTKHANHLSSTPRSWLSGCHRQS